MSTDLRFAQMAEERVRDVTSGRLPPEDVASNIAEDFARVRSEALEDCADAFSIVNWRCLGLTRNELAQIRSFIYAVRDRALDPKGAAGR